MQTFASGDHSLLQTEVLQYVSPGQLKQGVEIISIKMQRCYWKLVSMAQASQKRGAETNSGPSCVMKIAWAVPAKQTQTFLLTNWTETPAGNQDICCMGSQVYWFASSHLDICMLY